MHSPVTWYTQRVDDDDGDIRYEAHGPKESFVTFEGPNAKADCDTFMAAVSPHPSKQVHDLESTVKQAIIDYFDGFEHSGISKAGVWLAIRPHLSAASTRRGTEVVEAMRDAISKAVHIAAELVRGDGLPSHYAEDWKVRVPKAVLRQLEAARDSQRVRGVRLKVSVIDRLQGVLSATSRNPDHYQCKICGGNPTAFPYEPDRSVHPFVGGKARAALAAVADIASTEGE